MMRVTSRGTTYVRFVDVVDLISHCRRRDASREAERSEFGTFEPPDICPSYLTLVLT